MKAFLDLLVTMSAKCCKLRPLASTIDAGFCRTRRRTTAAACLNKLLNSPRVLIEASIDCRRFFRPRGGTVHRRTRHPARPYFPLSMDVYVLAELRIYEAEKNLTVRLCYRTPCLGDNRVPRYVGVDRARSASIRKLFSMMRLKKAFTARILSERKSNLNDFIVSICLGIAVSFRIAGFQRNASFPQTFSELHRKPSRPLSREVVPLAL